MGIFQHYRVLLILGNGFDLSLGLHTSYKSFIESSLFQGRVHIKHYPNAKRDLHDKNIHNYLAQKSLMKNWIDVEEELMRYASNQRVEYHNETGGLTSINNVSDSFIRNSYSLLCSDLQTYIQSLDYSRLQKDARSLRLLNLIASGRQNYIVSFNYTDLSKILDKSPRCRIDYIHGNITKGIILGFQRFDNMAAGYEYMIKSENPIYKSCHLSLKMSEVDEIIVFGHSLGTTDHCYFKPFFDIQTSERALPKRLTIFTKNGVSKDAIGKQLVELSDKKYLLFQDNTDIEIIETENNEMCVDAYLDVLEKRLRHTLLFGLLNDPR